MTHDQHSTEPSSWQTIPPEGQSPPLGNTSGEAFTSWFEGQTLWRNMLDQMPVGVLVAEAPSGRIAFGNSVMLRLLEDCSHSSAGVNEYVNWRLHHPDGRPWNPGEEPLARALRGEETHDVEMHLSRPDGSWRFVSVSGSPLRDGSGRIVAAMITVKDIAERKLVAEELHSQRELLEGIIGNIPVLLCIWDARLKRFRFNPHMRDTLGWSEADANQGNFMAKAYPDPAYRQMVSDYMQSLEGGWRDLKTTAKDGSAVDISWANVRLSDDTGIGIGIDIRERKRTEEALRKSETRFRIAQEFSLDAFTILSSVRDSHGVIIDFRWEYVNQEAGRLLQHPPQELVGKRLLHVLPGNKVNSDLFKRYARVVETGQSHDYEVYYEHDGIHGWFRNMAVKLEDGLAVCFCDITARKQAEAALLRRTESLTLLSQAASHLLAAGDPTVMMRELFDMVCHHLDAHTYFNFMLDETGQALRLDSCAGIPDEVARGIERLEFGVAICGMVAKNRHMIHATHIQESDDPKVQLVKGYGIRAYCCHPLMAGGRLLGTLSFGSRAKDCFDDVEVEFMRTVCHYVSMAKERLRLERELRQNIAELAGANQALAEADRRKDEFLAMLAHELRNPLAPIRNAAQVMRLAGSGEPRLDRQREIIDRQVTHMARLLDDLLDVSRISRGNVTLEKAPLALVDVLDQAVEIAMPLIRSRRHRLDYTPPADTLRVEGDPDRLTQIFGNLLTNAAKYTDEGGLLEIGIDRRDREVRVSVRDNGIGIEPRLLPYIFDLFVQDERTVDRSRGGLGIGLTMVQKLTQMHGGHVEARSEGRGRGSEFTISLPLLPDAEQAVEKSEAPCNAPANGQLPPRILIVDDLVDSAVSLAELLGLWGCQTRVAHDGQSALETARELKPDIVLLDLGMPGMDGFETARRLRKEHGSRLLLVALTGYGQDEDHRQTRQAGFDHHLVKPVDLEWLRHILSAPKW